MTTHLASSSIPRRAPHHQHHHFHHPILTPATMQHILWMSNLTFLVDHRAELSDVTFHTPEGTEIPHYSILFPLGSLDTFSAPSPESPSKRIIFDEEKWTFLNNEVQQLTALKSHYGHGGYTLRIQNESIPVHRILLHPIPYFRSLFNPGFPSGKAASTELPDDIFTVSAAREFVKFLYNPSLSDLTAARSAFQRDDTYESRLSSMELLELFRAADFLQFEDLEDEVVGGLRGKLAEKDGGVTAAMEILSGLVKWEMDDASERPRDLVTRAIHVLVTHPGGWKKPVVELPDDLMVRLISFTKLRAQDSLGALKLWTAIRKLQDGVDKSRSKIKDVWAERVFVPLLKHAAQIAAIRIEDGELKARLKKAVTAKRDIEELLIAAVKDGMTPKNALGICKTAEEVGGEMKAQAVKWMKQNWMKIVLENGGFLKGGWSVAERKKVATAIGRKPEDLD